MPLSKISTLKLGDRGRSHQNAAQIQAHIDSMNRAMQKVNSHIDRYNAATTPLERNARLALIEKSIKTIHNAQYDYILSYCPSYFTQVHGTLFKEIQAEKIKLGLIKQPSPDADITLTELIANMPPAKVIALGMILAKKDISQVNDGLKSLYKPGEPGKKAYDKFIQNHHVQFLGGGNSRNFVVENINTGAKQVLKLENRIGNPKKVEAELRESPLSSVFMPVHAERQLMYIHPNAEIGMTAGSIQVVDYSPGKDLKKHCALITDPNSKIEKITPLFESMADILQTMQAQNCAFPDMKSSNWLVDADGKLRLADGKSFIKLNDQGEVLQAKGYSYTQDMLSPEMQDTYNFSADGMHTYLLGKNLYQSLTGCNSSTLTHSLFRYTDPVFQSDLGKVVKNLLSNMLQDDPAHRPPLAKVQEVLKLIREQPDVAIETHKTMEKCYALLSTVSREARASLPILKNLRQQLISAENLEDFNAVYKDLQQTHELMTKIKGAEPFLSNWLSENKINEKVIGTDIAGYISSATQLLKEVDTVDGLKALDEVVNPPHLKEILESLTQIKKHACTEFGAQDAAMNKYISKVLHDIEQCQETADYARIHDNVKAMQATLETSKPITDEVRTLATQKKAFMASKGKRVLEAMGKVPLEERGNIPEGTTREAKAVLDAMASSRILPKFMSSKSQTKDPATMFKSFKEKYQQTTQSHPKEEKDATIKKGDVSDSPTPE